MPNLIFFFFTTTDTYYSVSRVHSSTFKQRPEGFQPTRVGPTAIKEKPQVYSEDEEKEYIKS